MFRFISVKTQIDIGEPAGVPPSASAWTVFAARRTSSVCRSHCSEPSWHHHHHHHHTQQQQQQHWCIDAWDNNKYNTCYVIMLLSPWRRTIGGFNQRQGEALPPQIFLTLKFVVWAKLQNYRNCCHLMSDFKAKKYQIRFRLGSAPDPARGARSAPSDPQLIPSSGPRNNLPPQLCTPKSAYAPDRENALIGKYVRQKHTQWGGGILVLHSGSVASTLVCAPCALVGCNLLRSEMIAVGDRSFAAAGPRPGTVYLPTSSLPHHSQHFVRNWKRIYFGNQTQWSLKLLLPRPLVSNVM